MASLTIVWLRLDLRLEDNPALEAAAQRGAVLPIYIWAPEEEGAWPPGGASRWWLHHSLLRLSEDFENTGTPLLVRRGSSLDELQRLVQESGADAVFWNRRYEPALVARDQKVSEALKAAGLEIQTFNSALLYEPWTIQNKSGKPFQVFTPYWKTCLSAPEPDRPLSFRRPPAPSARSLRSMKVDELGLEPKHPWTEGLKSAWQPGSAGAAAQLNRFLSDGIMDYGEARNLPAQTGTSRLSPHLHFGEISPRQIWHAVRSFAEARSIPGPVWRSWQFLTELGWREFAHHLLYHFPHTTDAPLRKEFTAFPWSDHPVWKRAWQRGRTGYPLVDAGMRELWSCGWMHNRIRMVTASFLVKNLLISWREGARWFWDTLVDADLANNTLGWQWTAGCGADAAPFFRIFNPVSQGEKFDAEGKYIRRWVAELATLPSSWIHQPWKATEDILSKAGISIGHDYPYPIVSLFSSREAALEAYGKIRGGNSRQG